MRCFSNELPRERSNTPENKKIGKSPKNHAEELSAYQSIILSNKYKVK